ncbi:MAG: VWA domain-containing protein, partial [Opitutales bacterium]
MTIFAEPAWLYTGLFFTFAVGILLWWSERRKTKRLQQFAAPKLLGILTPELSRKKTVIRCLALGLSVLILCLALARPQWGARKRKTTPTGIDVLVAIDVSRSMLARDVKPNRITRVKLGISNLLEKVKGDRLGLIPFAGTSFLQCPLTLDHSAFRRTLTQVEVGSIKRQGTDLASPIEEAGRSFSKDDNDRFLILISDGEDLEQRGLGQAKEAAKEGIRIFTIGIGGTAGVSIPLDPVNKTAKHFLRDPDGKLVVTTMDESGLRAIAESTGGKYYPLGPTGEGLAKIMEHLQSIGQQKRHAQLTEELPIERYQLFLLFSVILIAGEFMLGNRQRRKLRTELALLLLFFMPGCLREDNVKQAEQAHENKNYAKAAKLYEAELNATLANKKAPSPSLLMNAGLAHLDANNLQAAETLLEQALDQTVDDPSMQSIILNALGNIRYLETSRALDAIDVESAEKAWSKALANYQAAIAIDNNPKAIANRNSLDQQIKNRIKALVSRISGRVWRDLDGDGRPSEKEPRLTAMIFLDRSNDGEHNASSEPFVETDEAGRYSIKWISGTYPASVPLGCIIIERNATSETTLIPIMEKPGDKYKLVRLPKASKRQLNFSYRAAPMLKGMVWHDANQDGKRDENEKGHAAATLFIDLDGNLARDENEISFKPMSSGAFSQAVPPGRHVIGIELETENGSVTFPRGKDKFHVTSVDFETTASNLDFGIHSPNDQNQSNSQNEKPPPPSEKEEDQENNE